MKAFSKKIDESFAAHTELYYHSYPNVAFAVRSWSKRSYCGCFLSGRSSDGLQSSHNKCRFGEPQSGPIRIAEWAKPGIQF